MRIISFLFVALFLMGAFAFANMVGAEEVTHENFLSEVSFLSWVGDFVGNVIFDPFGAGGYDSEDFVGKEFCNDGIDNDGDGAIDCDDPGCYSDSVCSGNGEICNDGIDNDFDGLADCDDFDCVNDHA